MPFRSIPSIAVAAVRLILAGLALLLSGCAALGPSETLEQAGRQHLLDWPEQAAAYDQSCFNVYTRYSTWGVFIGCQAIDIFDIRSPNLFLSFNESLERQSCKTPLGTDGERNYVRTGEQLIFIDKSALRANAWYVPADYYSDGVSTPNILRELVPGAILDTESPRTLSAALFHDRYFCLYEYTAIAWNPDRENFPDRFRVLFDSGALKGLRAKADIPIAYRRRGCANVSFQNGLRAAGASNFIATIFRRTVGIVNGGQRGYCPRYVHAEALTRLDLTFEDLLDVGPISSPGRTVLPNCRAKEPMILCLADLDNLWFVIAMQPDDYGSPAEARLDTDWRQVLTRIFCYDLQARDARGDFFARFSFSENEAHAVCARVNINQLENTNDDIREAMSRKYPLYADLTEPIESPFRAGDFLVEGALLLTSENGPADFLRMVGGAATVDFAMLGLVYANVTAQEADFSGTIK